MADARWFDASLTVAVTGPGASSSHQFLGPPSSRATEVEGYGAPMPQAFLAAFRPDFTLGVHFHRVDQFQWFVRGEGTFAGHPIGPGTVHYADRLKPYGPLYTGDDGTSIVTLRTTSDSGAHFMPGERDRLREELSETGAGASARRDRTWDLQTTAAERGRWTDLCHDDDELRVAVIDLDAGDALPELLIGGGGGYLAVTRGALRTAEGLIGGGGFTSVDAATQSPAVSAGTDGCRVALLQLPRRHPR
jgi:hypothetical protein